MNVTGLDLSQALYTGKLDNVPTFQQWSLLGLIALVSWLFFRYKKRQRAWVCILSFPGYFSIRSAKTSQLI